MRILAVTPYYEPEGGGLERYAHAILSRLASRGHHVRTIASSRRPAAQQTLSGVQVDSRPTRIHLGNAPIELGLARRIRAAIRSERPDVIIGHAPVPYPAEIACSEARRAGIPFVLTYHAGRLRGSSVMLDLAASVARLTVERRMFAHSAGLIAVSPFVRDNALADHRERVRVIPPGVDGALFAPNQSLAGQEILFVGPLSRAYRWKGADVLIKAFQQVRAAMPDARLRLVGQGDRMAYFQGLAEQSDGAISISGRLDDDALIDAYRRARVVVLPSTTDAEAFGMVLAEANACGRPVVGSRIGGIPDFIEDGHNGRLVRPGDPEDLANVLLKLLQEPQTADALGRAGRERVLARHDWDPLAQQTERVLEDALGGD